jgi:hypothetical protein
MSGFKEELIIRVCHISELMVLIAFLVHILGKVGSFAADKDISLFFMEPDDSLRCSPRPTIAHYLEAVDCSLHFHTLFHLFVMAQTRIHIAVT